MGQPTSKYQGAFDHVNPILVESVHPNILRKEISKLLKSKKCSDLNPEDISGKVFECLAGKDWIIDDVQRNCKVFIFLEGVGEICVQSGIGAYKVVVAGNSASCQAMLLEYHITTSTITGLLINSLQHFLTLNPEGLMDTPTADASMSFKNARVFVQDHSEYEWNNAAIDFSGIFPLLIVSGCGENKFKITEINETEFTKRRQNESDGIVNLNIIREDVEHIDAEALAKLRLYVCGDEGVDKDHIKKELENQFIELTDYYKQNEKEKFWKNVEIKIFNYDTVYMIKNGTEKGKQIHVTFRCGKASVKLIN